MTPSVLNLGGPGPHGSATRLRRLALGELPSGEAKALQAHLATCARCQATRGALSAEDAELQGALPFDRFAAGVAERLAEGLARDRGVTDLGARRWGRALRATAWLAPAAAAAAVLLLAWPLWRGEPGAGGGARSEGNRMKGGPSAQVYVQSGSQTPHRLVAGEALPADAHLLLVLEPAGRRFFAAALREASGASLLQAGPATPGPLGSGFAWEGQGSATLVVRYSDQPIETTAWLDGLKASAAAPVGSDELWTVELRREPGRP